MRAYQQLKNIYHIIQAELWRAVYGWPDKKLVLYGVTGTNGKTTTSHLVASILSEQYGAAKVGMLTTIAFRFGTEEVINKSKMTTLKSKLVFQYLKKMNDKGVEHVVLEMTSHALDQNRLHGIHLVGAIILNIAREHLDYHKTMEAYTAAKQRILEYIISGGVVAGKGDDVRVETILKKAEQKKFCVERFTSHEAQSVETALPGAVNKENALAASKLMRGLGVPEAIVKTGIMAVKKIAGRMEVVKAPIGFEVIIDYAVTPDALERLYSDIRVKTTGRLYGILGAAGLRDRGKRSDMARVVAKYADEIVVTNEDPWTESEEQIFSDLEAGLKDTTKKWQRIPDRRAALQYFVNKAQIGDTIITTGKGAETGMAFGKTIVPWHERTVVEELIKNRS